jgi:hypothetical protein
MSSSPVLVFNPFTGNMEFVLQDAGCCSGSTGNCEDLLLEAFPEDPVTFVCSAVLFDEDGSCLYNDDGAL